MATWVGPPRSYTPGRARPIQYVVIHTTQGTEGTTSAEAGAAYDKVRTDGTSTHIFVDADTALMEVHYEDRAHAARFHGNEIGIQVELCGRAEQTPTQWRDPVSAAMLRLAAVDVAAMCREYGIPVRRLSVDQVRAAYYAPAGQRPKGICGHYDVTRAYPEDGGSHTDPGANFPWDDFLGMVRAELEDDVSAAEVWNYNAGSRENPVTTVARLNQTARDVKALDARLVAMTAAIEKLATAGGFDAAAVNAHIDEALAAHLVKTQAIVDQELDEQSRAGADAD